MKHSIRTQIYRSVTILLAGSFLMLGVSAYGVSILPVDTMIQQAYLRAENSSFTSLTNSLSQNGNIYDSAYSLARKTSLQNVSDTFISVAENLNSEYNCSLTASDVSAIAANDAYYNTYFASLAGKQTFPVDSESMVRGCVRVAQCVRGVTPGSDIGSLTNAYTTQTLPLCKSVVQSAFEDTIAIVSSKNTLNAANHGDDIFYNGSLDDSPFDLLLDMQLIGDILFKSNTAAPQIIMYDFPGAGNGGSPTFFNPTGNNEPNLSITTNGGNNNNSNNSNNSSSNNNSSNNNTTTTQGTTTTIGQLGNGSLSVGVKTTTQVQSQAINELTSYFQGFNQDTNNGTSTTTNTVGTTNAGGSALVCVTPVTSNQPVAVNASVQATQLENALSTYNEAINAPVALHNAMTSPEMQANESALEAIANLGNPSNTGNGGGNSGGGNGGNGGNNADPNAEANSCLSKCDPLAPADKAVCEAKCLCGTKYRLDGVVGLSVCTVPTTQTEVIGGKSVKSVEEIVDEINNVLTALRNSGQLSKHTKTKEFLDTSLSKIKLNQILSFDMNIAFKPIYDSNFQKDKDEAEKSKNDASADRARQGTYLDGGVGQEKNKYLMLDNPVRAQQLNTSLASDFSQSSSTSIDSSLPYNLAKTMNNTMINTISDFMAQNAILREQVADTLNAINTTATNLEKKIQKGK